MDIPELKYACPKNGCKFISTIQCDIRRGVIKPGKNHTPHAMKRKQTLDRTDLSNCRECSGPVPADKYVPKVRHEPIIWHEDNLPLSLFQTRNSPRIFTELGPNEMWTGSRCGCTKPRREFYNGASSECMACRLVREKAIRDGKIARDKATRELNVPAKERVRLAKERAKAATA